MTDLDFAVDQEFGRIFDRERSAPTGAGMLDVLQRSITEEAASLRLMVRDEETCCIARSYRAERLRAYEHVLALIEAARRWEW